MYGLNVVAGSNYIVYAVMLYENEVVFNTVVGELVIL